ncbi:MAG: GntR family transcriptional regulator [Gemmatimonadales bacterium]|nr:GntR family transcriptional regulator [Gemmatimonadales bacterium]
MIPRTTLADATSDALRERILSGLLPGGAPLRQEALATELGVSRIPLREALRQLEAEGLVTLLPHRGAVVTPIPLPHALELFELRAMVEGDLVHRAVPRMTPADDLTVTDQVRQFEAAVQAGDAAAWGSANWQLHRALYAPADRPVTLDVVARLHAQSDRYLRAQLTLTNGTAAAIREHRAITAAARRRSADLTARLVRDHILRAGRTLAAALRQQSEVEA